MAGAPKDAEKPFETRWFDLSGYDSAGSRPKFKNPQVAITLREEEMDYQLKGMRQTFKYADIRSVRLEKRGVFGQGTVFLITIDFGFGSGLTLLSTTEWGKIESDRVDQYADFVDALHERLARHAPPDTIFVTGPTSGHAVGFGIAKVVMIGFFGVGPLVLLVLVRRWEVLMLCLGALPAVYQSVRHTPTDNRHYLPDALPAEVLP
jgi:hypothetical protein